MGTPGEVNTGNPPLSGGRARQVSRYNTGVKLRQAILPLLGFAALTTVIFGLNIGHFAGRSYRDDEAIFVYQALERPYPDLVRWAATEENHPPGYLLLLRAWLGAAGHSEFAARLLSMLFMALALAFTYRLGADFFGVWAGVEAAALLGTWNFFQFFGGEVRPYAALTAFSAGMVWAFWRWLRRPTFSRALLYVALGVGGLYSHFFAIYVVIAQALALLIFTRFKAGRYARAFGLFALVAASMFSWIGPIAQRALGIGLYPGGLGNAITTDLNGLTQLWREMQFSSPALGLFLILVALLSRPLQPADRRRKWYILALPLLMLAAALPLNRLMPNVTARNLIIMLPPLALAGGYALRSLPRRARVALIAALLLIDPADYQPLVPVSDYRALLAPMRVSYQPGSPVILGSVSFFRQWPLIYYLEYQIGVPRRDLLIYTSGSNAPFLRQFSERLTLAPAGDAAPAERLIGERERFWLIDFASTTTTPLADLAALRQGQYARVRSWQVGELRADEYRRAPPGETIYRFGDAPEPPLDLFAWQLVGGVTVSPCGSITLETWWRAREVDAARYSLDAVLVDSMGQGAARSEDFPKAMHVGQPDMPYFEARTIRLPCDFQAGEYSLIVIVYDAEKGVALPIRHPDGTPASAAYLTTIQVE